MKRFFRPPARELSLIFLLAASLVTDYFVTPVLPAVLAFALLGSLPIAFRSFASLARGKITIDTFNLVALVISFAAGEIASAGFIALMLSFASLLDWHTESRTSSAVEELLKLKPDTALREKDGALSEVPLARIKEGDIVVVENGARVPVDGRVVFGRAYVNEAPMTGESAPAEKVVGDRVFGATLNESGMIKVRAIGVGKDSTIERMAELIREGAKHKSRSERLADRFAGIFLPVVLFLGIGTYALTRNVEMTAALFLVACADDMAVAIPLAITASLGRAAKRGVIVKGGEWLDALSRAKVIVLDKTGTLTYGNFAVGEAGITGSLSPEQFWRLVGIAEKFSEHPAGRALFRKALAVAGEIPDPEKYAVYKGAGVLARAGKDEIIIGNEKIFSEHGLAFPESVRREFLSWQERFGNTVSIVLHNDRLAGFVTVADAPRSEAKQSLEKLRAIGVARVIMFTGDNEEVAKTVCAALGIAEFRAGMTPEAKLRELEALQKGGGGIIMAGDGVNDAPALSRADVGIAMGSGGTATAVEAADVIILTDDLSRIAEMVMLGRRTVSVIHADMAIWFATNMIGFALVFSGLVGPAAAAFYNFATDFLPLVNSGRLFKR